MNFEHTEDRRMLADSLGRYLREQYPFETRDRTVKSEQGWSPCAAAVLGSPNAQGKPAQHLHLPLGGRTAPGKAGSGRRLLGTNGATLWLWSCLPKPVAPGP